MAFVIFGLCIGHEHKFCLYQKAVPDCSAELTFPVTVIPVRYITSALLLGSVERSRVSDMAFS